MKKESIELKRLIRALDDATIIHELEDAKKYSKNIYDSLVDLDLQTDVEALSTSLLGTDYGKRELGKQFTTAKGHLDNAVSSFLELNKQLRQEIKHLKAPEIVEESPKTPSEESPKKELSEKEVTKEEPKVVPPETVVTEKTQQSIVDEIMAED